MTEAEKNRLSELKRLNISLCFDEYDSSLPSDPYEFCKSKKNNDYSSALERECLNKHLSLLLATISF